MSSCCALLALSAMTVHAADLLVAAASDLTTLQQPLVQLAKAEYGGNVRFTFASSGTLARQIENGAPFDVFLSANKMYVDELARSGKLEAATVRVYAVGRLGLWSRDGSIRDLKQLGEPGVKHLALANPAFAPYGAAAKELLTRRGMWPAIESKVVYGENVKQALQFAESGNADAVITSWSLLYDRTNAMLLPADHAPIEQAGGVVSTSGDRKAARQFLDMLTGPRGRKLLESHGLGVPQPK